MRNVHDAIGIAALDSDTLMPVYDAAFIENDGISKDVHIGNNELIRSSSHENAKVRFERKVADRSLEQS